ncbi:MAG: FHA domain-containing protein [Deltaproteobacteria bacterium]|nr:FHA domain-containing protein [Deltaproteobacteria bacterium]
MRAFLRRWQSAEMMVHMKPRWLLSISLLFFAPLSAHGAPVAPMSASLVVEGRLTRLPQSKRCHDRKLTWVVTHYWVEKVVAGSDVRARDTIAVAHACPHRPRGFSRFARGDASHLSAGNRHRLRLVPFVAKPRAKVIDLVPLGKPRYQAIRTDSLDGHPQIIVTVRGPGRRHRLPFAAQGVTIGSSSEADVRLAGPTAPLHAEIVVEGDALRVRPLGDQHILIDGARLSRRGRKITYRSKVVIGPYTLSVSLLPPAR